MKAHPPSLSLRRGFTMVELMVVLTIMAILLTLTGPSLMQALQGTSLNRAAILVQNNLKVAHQYALSLQYPVAVRFYQIPKTTGNFSALQLFEVTPQVDNTGAMSSTYKTYLPLTPVINLPAPNIMLTTITASYTYSSLLTGPSGSPITPTDPSSEADVQTPISIPIYGVGYSYVQFQFLPNGETDLPIPTSLYYVTVASSTQAASPVNFFTIQVDPLTGKVTSYRP